MSVAGQQARRVGRWHAEARVALGVGFVARSAHELVDVQRERPAQPEMHSLALEHIELAQRRAEGLEIEISAISSISSISVTISVSWSDE